MKTELTGIPGAGEKAAQDLQDLVYAPNESLRGKDPEDADGETPLQIIPAVQVSQIQAIAALAAEIWNECYPPIIGQDQVDYMVGKFQSPQAIAAQMHDEGYQYFMLRLGGDDAGYLGVKVDGDQLFLSKIYVRSCARGKGVAAKAIAFLEDMCRENGLAHIWLTVNKHNSSAIGAYGHLGFCMAYEQATDIGGGYVMDDYIMKKAMPANENA